MAAQRLYFTAAGAGCKKEFRRPLKEKRKIDGRGHAHHPEDKQEFLYKDIDAVTRSHRRAEEARRQTVWGSNGDMDSP